MNNKHNHGADVIKYKQDVLSNFNNFLSTTEKFLHEIEFMESFYQWPKQKQREIEPKYYIAEKKILACILYSTDERIKNRLILHFVRIYRTLVYKYIGWYEKSQYQCLHFSTDELKTTLEALLVSTVYHYCEKLLNEGVRIPFGSYLKNRIFIQFRGELQDVYRKTILYEQWKDKLYEKSISRKTKYDIEKDYQEISDQMEYLKTNLLLESQPQSTCDFNNIFMYNYLLVYHFFNKKQILPIQESVGYNYKTVFNQIKNDLKCVKDKVRNDQNY